MGNNFIIMGPKEQIDWLDKKISEAQHYLDTIENIQALEYEYTLWNNDILTFFSSINKFSYLDSQKLIDIYKTNIHGVYDSRELFVIQKDNLTNIKIIIQNTIKELRRNLCFDINDLNNHSDCSDTVFVVHGRDIEMRDSVVSFLKKNNIKYCVLEEKASLGQTLIEKILSISVGFAIILYSDKDDYGGLQSDLSINSFKKRARQNVVFEHGLFIGKLGREKVVFIMKPDVEIPSDIEGLVYISYNDNWQDKLKKELIFSRIIIK